MTISNNGKPPGQYVQQVVGLTDVCENCGEAAMAARIDLLLRPSYIQVHAERGQPPQGRPVLAHVLCFHCLRRDVIRWDDQGKKTVENVGSFGNPIERVDYTSLFEAPE